jgi:hypothetical protein
MNPLALLQAGLALTLFPGLAYAGVTARLVAWAGRLPAGRGPASAGEAVAAFGVLIACGVLALPGSPLFGLPTGVSLLPLLLVLAGATAWGTSPTWPWHRLAAAAAMLIPLLAVAGAAGTLDAGTIAAAPAEAARFWWAGAAVLAVPAALRPFDATASRLSRSALLGGVLLAVISLAAFSPLAGVQPALAATIIALVTLACAAVLGRLHLPFPKMAPVLGLVALAPAAVALALAVA